MNRNAPTRGRGWRVDRRCSAWVLLWLALAALASAAEVMPPAPPRYFNDYAQVVSPATAERLNRTLEDFEKSTSSQILVAIYPKMQSDSSVEDYTIRVARAWRVGQKAKNNGAILFIFIKDRTMRMEVGYGLEGALPDAIAKRIIEEEIKPHFQRGDYDGGVTAGVNAMLLATRGEYEGSGRTAAHPQTSWTGWIFPLFVLFVILMVAGRAAARGTVYRRSGRRTYWGGWPGGGWSAGTGSWSGGGSSGGGFSGGGGGFGGGGASGRW